MVVFDATMMLLMMRPNVNAPDDPATGKPVEFAAERIQHLVDQMGKARTTIIVPTPALSEMLVKSGTAGPKLVATIQNAAVFRIAPFDTLAAIEVAEMSRIAHESGRKRGSGASGDTWSKIKYDRQIVAIGKVQGASKIYTDDRTLCNFSLDQGLEVVRLAEIILPPEVAQGHLDLPVHDQNGDDRTTC